MATPTNPIEQLTFDMATGSTPVTYDITTKYFAGQEIEIPDQYVRITDLETGLYKLTYNGAKYIYYYGSTATSTHTICGGATYGSASVFLFVRKSTISGTNRWHWWYMGDSGSHPIMYYGNTSTSSGTNSSKSIHNLLTSVSPHASAATTYGVGTTTNYGHCKMVTGDVSSVTSATNGVVAASYHNHDTKYAAKDHTHDNLGGEVDDGDLATLGYANFYFAIDGSSLQGSIALPPSSTDLVSALTSLGYTSVSSACPVSNVSYNGTTYHDGFLYTSSGFIYFIRQGNLVDSWPTGTVSSFTKLP